MNFRKGGVNAFTVWVLESEDTEPEHQVRQFDFLFEMAMEEQVPNLKGKLPKFLWEQKPQGLQNELKSFSLISRNLAFFILWLVSIKKIGFRGYIWSKQISDSPRLTHAFDGVCFGQLANVMHSDHSFTHTIS